MIWEETKINGSPFYQYLNNEEKKRTYNGATNSQEGRKKKHLREECVKMLLGVVCAAESSGKMFMS